MGNMPRWIKVVWAAPCSIVGLLLGGFVVLLGGSAARIEGTLEIVYRPSPAQCGRYSRKLPYRAITFGHVIVAVTAAELGRCRRHERVHVKQYEHWGPFFFVAYAASSAWQLINRRRPYWDNHFEVQARRRSRDEARTR